MIREETKPDGQSIAWGPWKVPTRLVLMHADLSFDSVPCTAWLVVQIPGGRELRLPANGPFNSPQSGTGNLQVTAHDSAGESAVTQAVLATDATVGVPSEPSLQISWPRDFLVPVNYVVTLVTDNAGSQFQNATLLVEDYA